MKSASRFASMVAVVMSLVPCIASGERADREREMDISSKLASLEGTKEENIKKLEGDVLITRGTMRITADRATVKTVTEGTLAELFGNTAKQITFRQKREGTNDYAEASADRAEYDDNTGTLKLFSKVRFKSGGDLVESEYMMYNTNTEKMELRNQIPGAKSTPGADDGRVVFKVQPRVQPGSPSGDGKTPPAKAN